MYTKQINDHNILQINSMILLANQLNKASFLVKFIVFGADFCWR